jgi:hypothetical protein
MTGETSNRTIAHEQADAAGSSDRAQPADATANTSQQAQALLAQGGFSPNVFADLIRKQPGARDSVLALLQRQVGNAATQAVVKMLAEPAGAPPTPSVHMHVNAPHGLRVRSTPDATSATNVLGLLPDQQEVSAKGRSGDWLSIEYAGQPAFVSGQYVEDEKGQPQATHSDGHASNVAPASTAAPHDESTHGSPSSQGSAAPSPAPAASAPTISATAPPTAATGGRPPHRRYTRDHRDRREAP